MVNYVDIINLLPKPPSSATKAAQTPSPAPSVKTKTDLLCPVQINPCPQGEKIKGAKEKPDFIGILYNLPAGTALIAPISGTYGIKDNLEINNVSGVTVLTIIGTQEEIRFVFIIRRGISADNNSGTVNKNEVLGTLGSKKEKAGELQRLIVTVLNRESNNFLDINSTERGIEVNFVR